MTGRGIPQRNKLSPRLNVPVRNYDGKAMYFRERQKFSLTQPYLDADIAVKVLAEGMVATGSGGDREMTGDDDQPAMAEFRFDPLARRQPGQVLKLHTTYKEATTPGDDHNWGWVDPEPELSDEDRLQLSEEAADFVSKRPQVIVRQFLVDKDGNETGETNEIAVKQLGPTINDMMPGQAIKLRKAIAKGIVIDANGQMRCPPGTPNANQFTDVDMSNCFNIGVGAVQKEIRRIRGFWKEWNEDVAAIRSARTAKERLGKAKENYTSLEQNAEWLARNEQSIQDAYETLGIDLSQFTPEQLKNNVHLFTAMDELFKNHDGPEFRRFLHDAIGFKWDDSKSVDENMKDYWETLRETAYKLVPEEVKKALLIDPSTKKPIYPDQYDEAQKIVDMMIDRFREVQEGIIHGALVSFNDNPQMFQTLREIGFDAWNGRVGLNEWMSYEGITNPITDELSPGRLGTQINFNTWALAFKPLIDLRKLEGEGRFEIDLKPVDAQGTPLSDIEKLKQIRDIIAHSNEVDHFIHGVGYANEQSSARASAVAGMSPAKAKAMHVMFHEFGHVLQYAEAQNAIIDYVNKHGQLVVTNNGALNVLTGDWRTWSNNDWYDALNTVMRGTFEGMNYPPVTVDWLEDSMLHLLAGQYYQDELGKWQRMHLSGGEGSPMLKNAQVGLMIQEARAELYALRQMGVISGPDIDKAIGGMDEVRRPPGIELASRPIYDAPTENISRLVPKSIFSDKRDLRRKPEYPPEVTKLVKKMKKENYTPEQILNELNAGDPENPKFTLDDVNNMIGDTGADDVPSDWKSPERENGIPKFDPANGIYADWSPDPNDDGKTRQAKLNQAIEDYAYSDEFLQDMEDAGFDQTDENHMGDFVGTKKYKEGLKKYQEKYGKPSSDSGNKTNEEGTSIPDETLPEPKKKRDIPAWDGQVDPFANDYSEVKLTDALIDDYTNTDYTIDELAERYDRTPEEVKAKIDLEQKLNGPIRSADYYAALKRGEWVNYRNPNEDDKYSDDSRGYRKYKDGIYPSEREYEIRKEGGKTQVRLRQIPSSEDTAPVTPASNPKEWGRQRRQEILNTTEPETVALLDGSIPPDKRTSTSSLSPRNIDTTLRNSMNARSKAKEEANTIAAPTPDAESPLLDEEIRDAVAPMLFHIDSHEFDEDMSVLMVIDLPENYEIGGGDFVNFEMPMRGVLPGRLQPKSSGNKRAVRVMFPAGSRGVIVGNSYNGDSDGVLLPPGRVSLIDVDENGVINAIIASQENPLETLKRMDGNIDDVSSAEGADDFIRGEASIVKAEIGRQIDKYANSERGRGMRSRSRGSSNDALTRRDQKQRNDSISSIMRRKNSAPFNVDNNFSARHRNPDGTALSTQWGDVVPREVHVDRRNNRVTASIGRMRNILNGDVAPSSESEFDFINNIDPRVKNLLNNRSPEEIRQLIDDAYVDFHKGFDDRVRIPMNDNTLNGMMSEGRLKAIQEIKPNSPISKLKSDHELFLGYDPEVSNNMRSISGYMVHRNAKNVISDHLDSIPSDGINRNPDFFHESGDIQPMGDVRIGGNDIDLVLKPEVASRSAYSRGEAIRSHNYPTPVLFDNPGDVGSAHLNESITSGNSDADRMRNITNALQNVIDNNFSGSLSDDISASRSERALRPGNKYEALVAGGVSLDDVAEIRYPVNKLDINNEKLDMNSSIGDSGRELLKVNGFGDGEIDEYLRMVDDGEVELQSARWLKQHRAAKKFETDFRKKNNFDGRIVFTNSDGIDLLSPETFREHPNSRGLQTVEQMLSARMLADMAPNMKKTLKAIKKSPDAQARIRSAQIGQNKKPNVDVPNAGSRINSIEDNEVDDIFNSLTDDLRNIAQGVDVEDRGMRSRSVPENLPPETFSYGDPENADVPGKKAFRDNSIYVTRNDDGTFNAYTIENYPGTELGYLRQVGNNNHESLAAAKNAANGRSKLSSSGRGMRSRSVPENLPPETFSYGDPENADVPGKKAFRDNSIYVTRNDDGTFNAYTIENYPGTELGYLRQVGNNNHESLAAAKNAANGRSKLSSSGRGMRSITGSNDSNAARESRRLTGTNFDEMSDEELDKIINEGDTSQIGGNRDIYFFGAVEERNRRKGIKPFNSNDFDFDISRFSNSSRPTSRRNSRQSPPDNRLLDNESGTRSRPVPKTFNDYVENPPRQGMRSQSRPKPPQYPRKPTMGAFIGSADSEFDGITNWEDFKRVLADKEIVFIDYETTGLKFNEFNESAGNGLPTQIGAVKMKNGKVIDRFNVFVNPGTPMSQWEKWSQDNLKDGDGNPITDAYLADKPSIAEAHKQLVEFMGNTELMGMQNAVFDNEVLEDALKDSGIDWRPKGIIDTKEISDMVLPKWSETNQNAPFKINKDGTKSPSNSLGDITKYLGIELGDKHHNADADAEATAKVMQGIIDGAIENNWPTDVLDKSKRRSKENETKTKFEKAVAAFESEKETFLNDRPSSNDEGGMRSRTATKPTKSTTKRTPKPKAVEPREYRNSNTENLPQSRDYYNVEDIDNAMRDIIDDVYSGVREPQDITDRVNALRDEIKELGSSSGMPDDMIEDLLDGTKTGPIASEVNDVVGGFERWGGLRSRSNVGSNARSKAGVAGRIISSERSRKALEKIGIDEDRAEAVQLLGEMAAAFSISGPAGMGTVLARRAGRDVADFGLAEAVERGWMSQATADKIAKRMLDRVAPEGLPDDIKDIIEKGKDAVTSDESKAKAAELLDTIRETVRSGGMQRLVDSAKQRTRVLTDIAKERGRELAAEKMREAREIARDKASELADDAMDALKERGKEAAGRLVGRFARRGGR
jgi:DNA polymerase III epsilon subunit-like protein